MTSMLALAAGLAMSAAGDAETGVAMNYRHMTGQEIVYAGTIVETYSAVKGVKYEQPYDLETTILVSGLDASMCAEAAAYTVVRMPNHDVDANRNTTMEDVATFHFDTMKITPRGGVTWRMGARKGMTAAPMADGLAPWEIGYCMEMPAEPASVGTQWTVQREGQPPIRCSIVGKEMVDGEMCMRIMCTQMAPTWTLATVTMPTWKSECTLWHSPKRGAAMKVMREYCVRQPGETEPSRIVKTNYALATNLVYSGPQLLERVADVEAACEAQEEWEKYVAGKSPRAPKNHLADIQHKIKFALGKPNASPYRVAMQEMMNVVEEAAKSAPAVRRPTMMPTVPHVAAAVGRKARSLAIRDVEKDEVLTLKNFKDKAVVLVYCDPESPLSRSALDAVVKSIKFGSDGPTVYAVCSKADKLTVDMLRRHVFGNYKVCKPQAMDRSYGMTACPHTIMVDEMGVLRANFCGYGPELGVTIAGEIESMAKRRQQTAEKNGKTTFQR